MNIEIKLTIDQLAYLVRLFESSQKIDGQTFLNQKREAKVLTSIMIDIADKFIDKFKTLSRKTTMFDTKKKHKMSFKFYQAHAISVVLLGFKNNEIDPYRRSMAELIFDQLEKKLV